MFYCHQAAAVVADRRLRFCDGCEETVATDRSLASASQTVLQMDHQLIGCHANLPIIALLINYPVTMIE